MTTAPICSSRYRNAVVYMNLIRTLKGLWRDFKIKPNSMIIRVL